MGEKVSIIMPVYNSANSLDLSVNSIINQDYQNIELIIIDDGSTDGSYEKCNKYKSIDNRIVLYRNNDKGVSSARNLGISYSTGDYICFVDSDDYIDKNAISSAVLRIKNSDIVFWEYYYEKGINKQVHSIPGISNDVSIEDFLSNYFVSMLSNYIINNIGTKLYRKQIISDYKLMFGKYNICEDIGFVIDYLYYAKKVSFIRVPYYHYVCNVDGLMHKKKNNHVDALTSLLLRIDNLFLLNRIGKSLNYKRYVFKSIRSLFIDSYLTSINKYEDYDATLNNGYFISFMKDYINEKISSYDKIFCSLFLKKKIGIINLFLFIITFIKDNK